MDSVIVKLPNFLPGLKDDNPNSGWYTTLEKVKFVNQCSLILNDKLFLSKLEDIALNEIIS